MRLFKLTIFTALTMSPLPFGTSAAIAQTSTDLFKTNPEYEYQAAKRVMEQFYYRYQKDRIPFSATTCTEANMLLGKEDFWYKNNDIMIAVADLAYRVVYLSNDLQRLGYPPAIWKNIILEYERDVLQHLSPAPSEDERQGRLSEFTQELRRSLDAYRSSHPTIKEEYMSCGPGDAEIQARIVTQPRASQVLFTPSFYYDLCIAQKIDPEDTKRCNRWREAVDGKVEWVSGEYYYIARWPDGTTRRGKFRFAADDSHVTTITLRKP